MFCAGPIPTEIGQLTSLAELKLYDNGFSGSCVHSCYVIDTSCPLNIDLGVSSYYAGRIPTEIGKLAAITDLWLESNRLDGACVVLNGCRKWHDHCSIAWVVVACFVAKGHIPTEICGLSNLQSLSLADNQFCGAYLSEQRRCTMLVLTV